MNEDTVHIFNVHSSLALQVFTLMHHENFYLLVSLRITFMEVYKAGQGRTIKIISVTVVMKIL
jgi:hypothetical protein